uniref:Uncharacterized protein n=1 Tax=Romanomermis culicivorax TaxID=13658 RepID=A0A915IDZ9_ROMCU
MSVFYQLTIGIQAKTLMNVQKLANDITKACSILNAIKAEIHTTEWSILVNQAVPDPVMLQWPQPSFHQFDHCHSTDCSQDYHGDHDPSADSCIVDPLLV